jgi:exodeoxyribonuclease VII large subunit
LILERNVRLYIEDDDRELALSLGALEYFDGLGVFCGYYAPKGIELTPLRRWMIESDVGLKDDLGDESRGDLGFGNTRIVERERPKEKGLSDLLREVGSVIKSGRIGRQWVVAEVLSVKKGHHCYLELVEYNNGKEVAKIRAAIWSSKKKILSDFESSTGLSLESGMKVLLRAEVIFSEIYGISLSVDSIDASYTRGDMKNKVALILEDLKKSGLFRKNKELPSPRSFKKVAIIAPDNAAGFGDFMSKASALIKHQVCGFDLFKCKFQGNSVVDDITRALAKINERHELVEPYDATVIIRGGGDKSGLYSLNDYAIAEAICLSKVPVITGIGHEQDSTVLDLVSWMRCPTPSLVISHIINAVFQEAADYHQAMGRIGFLSERALRNAKENQESSMRSINSSVKNKLTSCDLEISRLVDGVKSRSKSVVQQSKSNLESLYLRIDAYDPSKILSRGFAAIRKENGSAFGGCGDFSIGSKVVIDTFDCRVVASVENVSEKI